MGKTYRKEKPYKTKDEKRPGAHGEKKSQHKRERTERDHVLHRIKRGEYEEGE